MNVYMYISICLMHLLLGGEAVARVLMPKNERAEDRCIWYTGESRIEGAKVLKFQSFQSNFVFV